MSDGLVPSVKILVDEDLSPYAAHQLRTVDGVDAIAVRDRGHLGALDHEVLELAFREDRILATANVADFERLACSREIHAGIILVMDGGLLRHEQHDVLRQAVHLIEAEYRAGRDMVNRVLRISADGTAEFEAAPS